MNKRSVDLVVLSDLHLGTVGCHAAELAQCLNSIQPRILVLNGDIFYIWNFKKYYWPESHMKVVKYFLSMMANGTDIYYLTGNHDEVIRKISSLQLGPLFVKDKLGVMTINSLQDNAEKIWQWLEDREWVGIEEIADPKKVVEKILDLGVVNAQNKQSGSLFRLVG